MEGEPGASSHDLSLIIYWGREGYQVTKDQGSAPISLGIK